MLQPENLRVAGLCAVLALLIMVAMTIVDLCSKPRVQPTLNLVAIGLGTVLVFALAVVRNDLTRTASSMPIEMATECLPSLTVVTEGPGSAACRTSN